MGSETLLSVLSNYVWVPLDRTMGSETLPSNKYNWNILRYLCPTNLVYPFTPLQLSDESSIPYLWGRKRFLLPVTYFPTILVYPFTLRVNASFCLLHTFRSSIPFYSTSNDSILFYSTSNGYIHFYSTSTGYDTLLLYE